MTGATFPLHVARYPGSVTYMETTTATTATDAFNRIARNSPHGGTGYLAERRNAGPWATQVVRAADEAAWDAMADWTEAERFAWANSTQGAYYGQEAIGGSVARAVGRYVERHYPH